jgi:hypothetical protein
LKETGPETWDTTIKRDGRVVNTARRVISNDGKRLDSEYKCCTADNKQVTIATYERTGNGSGLAGEWRMVAQERITHGVLTFEVIGDGNSEDAVSTAARLRRSQTVRNIRMQDRESGRTSQWPCARRDHAR